MDKNEEEILNAVISLTILSIVVAVFFENIFDKIVEWGKQIKTALKYIVGL